MHIAPYAFAALRSLFMATRRYKASLGSPFPSSSLLYIIADTPQESVCLAQISNVSLSDVNPLKLLSDPDSHAVPGKRKSIQRS